MEEGCVKNVKKKSVLKFLAICRIERQIAPSFAYN